MTTAHDQSTLSGTKYETPKSGAFQHSTGPDQPTCVRTDEFLCTKVLN